MEKLTQEQLSALPVEEVHARLLALQNEHEGCHDKIEQLESKVTTLEEDSNKKDVIIAGLENDCEKKDEEIESLNDVIANAGGAEKIVSTIPEITHDEKIFLVKKQSFRLLGDDKLYTTKDLKADYELVKRVLALNGQSILEEKQ